MNKSLFKLSKLIRKSHVLGIFCIVFSLYGQEASAQSLNISVNNEPLENVFKMIARQSSYNFVYGDDYLKGTENVTLKMQNASLTAVLDECLKGTGLWYRIEDREIIIVSPKFQQPAAQKAATRNLQGFVYDIQGTPLAGAAVTLADTRKGTVTDASGFFSVPIPAEGTTIRVSYLGMVPQSVVVKDQNEITVKLQYDAKSIENVVVTAYGLEQKKEDLVGSAFQVNANQLQTLPTARIDRMLEGLVPGFAINSQADYAEGRQRYKVRIRGESSLNASGEPLWIVDGVRMYMGDKSNAISGSYVNVSPLSMIDPNDIESVTVLKDATQTSIYGSDGANGVVVITTKRGTKGALDVTASVKYGIGTTDNSTKIKILNGPQYLTLAKEAWLNADNDMSNFPWNDNYMNSYSTTDTDWFSQFFGMGQSLDAYVSVRGGGEKISNYVSFGYFNDRPIMKGNTTNRFNMRFNSTMEITRKLLLSTNFGFTYAIDNVFNPSESYLSFLPIYSPYYEDSPAYRLMNVKTNLDGVETQYRFANRLAERDENTFVSRNIKPIGAVTLRYDIIKGLQLSGNFGIDYNGVHDEIYNARTNLSGASWVRDPDDDSKLIYSPQGTSRRNLSNNMIWSSFESISYDRTFGKHSIYAQGGIEWYSNSQQTMQVWGYGYPNDKMQEVSYANENERYGGSNSKRTKKLSYMGRFNYSYDSRYYISGSFRYDGSSVFGEYHQWKPFFSIGGSWNIHNEKFFNVRPVNKLKLRVTYGSVGNSRIESVLTNGSYSFSTGSGYRGNVGGTMSSTATKGLSWEKVLKTNVGLDIGLFDRLDFSLEWYSHRTVDLIADMGVSMLTGERTLPRNIGIMTNKGVELNITSTNIATPVFQWRTSFNLSHNKNKVVKLYAESSKSFFEYGWYEGYEKNVYTVIRYAGVDPGDGSPVFYDKNGNLTKTYAYDNRVPLLDKSRYPTVYGGMTNTFRWKDFDLVAMLVFSVGGWSYATGFNYVDDGKNLNSLTLAENVLVETLDRWQKPGDITYVPELISDMTRNSMSYNTRRLVNNTNIRLSNLALGYTVPSGISGKLRMKTAKVSFIVDNVFIWVPNSSKTRNSYKTLMNTIPTQRTYSLELSFSL